MISDKHFYCQNSEMFKTEDKDKDIFHTTNALSVVGAEKLEAAEWD